MRPGKKKTRHHDSQKCANKAKAKLAAENKASEADKNAPSPVRRPVVPAELRTKNESDGGDKSSGSDDEVSTSSSQYARRNISSNWTKYELPSSSGEEEDELSAQELMTGQDFTAVVENAAGGSDTFFRLKSEKEWDEAQCLFQNDLFSLDLKDLEAAVGCIPLDAQIDLDMSDMNEDTYSRLHDKAALNMSNYAAAILRQNDEHSDAVVAVEDINAALISKLRITPEKPKEKAPPPGFAGAKLNLKTPPQNVTSLPKSQSTAAVPEKSKNSQPEDVEHLEEWLDDFLDD